MNQTTNTNSPLWRRIQRYVQTGKETPKVDFKLTMKLGNKNEKAEFAKDTMAIANTRGGDGYLLIGIQDRDRLDAWTWEDSVVGFSAQNGADEFYRQMIDAVTDFCNPLPQLEYDEIIIPGVDKTIGIVSIRRSRKRPHSFRKDCSSGRQDEVPVRRGTKTFPIAAPDEIREMFGQVSVLPEVIVVNVSGHPLSDDRREQIEREAYIQELIEVSPHFSAPPLEPQINALVAQIGLTEEEWQNEAIVVIPPGLAAPAVALFAKIHGLRGGFPRMAWIRPDANDRSIYNIDQIVGLQEIRDEARTLRT